jgi:flagellar motor switch protein FliM
MSENFLTPAEIEALLGQHAPGLDSISAANARETGSAGDAGGTKTKIDAAKRPHESAADRRRRNRLWAIHEQAARDAGVALSALLRAAVDVRLTGIDTIGCQTFAASMRMPTCVGLLRSPTVAGQLVLELPATILIPMLDRMLGSSVNTISTATPRALSEIEQRLAMRIATCIAGELSRAWESTIDLAMSLDRIETDPRWLSIGPPESDAVVASFDARLGKARGVLRFGIPPQAMDVLERYLSTDPRATLRGQHHAAFDRGEMPDDQAELTVELSPSPTTSEDVANLNIGDVIATEHRIDAPVIVNLDGEPKFLGRLGATAGQKAVRIIEAPEQTK